MRYLVIGSAKHRKIRKELQRAARVNVGVELGLGKRVSVGVNIPSSPM